MAELDDLYITLQAFLMKKDKECDELRFLTSRTTVQISEHIEDVCSSILEIFHASDIPVEEHTSKTNSRCVQAFKYLVLNTCFDCQENLTEDLVNGHLVDMCPPLSPYLLIEILWSLRYEEIVAEFILYSPLDLATELVAISLRCINLLEFQRRLNFLTLITTNCYKKLFLIARVGTQAMKLDDNLESLMIHCQELMALFCDPKFTKLNDVVGLKKYERYGLILKRLLFLTKDCLQCIKNDIELPRDMETMYKVTFGREPVQRANDNFPAQLAMLAQEFIHLLLKRLKEIDCNTYVGWADLTDSGNLDLSLQTSIGNDCYRLIEFLPDYENLFQPSMHDHLMECLKQLSSKPKLEESSATMDLESLQKNADAGKKDCLKELMKRYPEWNHEIFNTVQRNRASLDSDDFLNLLEYLTLLMTREGQEEHKREVYTTVTKVLLQQEVSKVYETTLSYILKHDARNTLESSHTEDSFVKFMSHNTNFKSPRNLRLVLFFLLKNPRKILSILLKIAIGDSTYENMLVTPNDLILLSPVMNIREKADDTLLLVALRGVCLEGREWNAKKFAHLVHVFLENCVLSADKIVNKLFIPCLDEKQVPLSSARCILNCLRKIGSSCTKETNFATLMMSIAKRMSHLRNDITVPKYSSNEALSLMKRVVEIFCRNVKDALNEDERKALSERLEGELEPLEKPNFSGLLISNPCQRIDIYDTIKDYERRCFTVMNRVYANDEFVPNEPDPRTIDLSRYNEDFLRHLILKSTETEYVRSAIEATIFHWDNLGCKNEYEAYEKIIRITLQASIYCLEFPALNSPDSFACLLKALAGFTRSITSLQKLGDTRQIYQALTNGVRKLEKSVDQTGFSSLYTNFVLTMNNRPTHEPIDESLREMVRLIDDLGNKCLEISRNVNCERTSHTDEAKKYKVAHDFIAECLSVDDDGSYSSLARIYNFFRSNEVEIDAS